MVVLHVCSLSAISCLQGKRILGTAASGQLVSGLAVASWDHCFTLSLASTVSRYVVLVQTPTEPSGRAGGSGGEQGDKGGSLTQGVWK